MSQLLAAQQWNPHDPQSRALKLHYGAETDLMAS